MSTLSFIYKKTANTLFLNPISRKLNTFRKGEYCMGKRERYEAKTKELIQPVVEANGVELFDVDYERRQRLVSACLH